MESINRRSFIGAMAGAAVLGVAGVAHAQEAFDDHDGDAMASAAAASQGSGYDAASIGVDISGMPFGSQRLTLEQMDQIRNKIIEESTSYTMADGTQVPEAYVKLRALFDTFGMGVGSDVTDASFGEIMFNFSEEEADAYLHMPRGVYFTATDLAINWGCTEEEAEALCQDLSYRGLLFRTKRSGVFFYHIIAEAHGIWEYTQLWTYFNMPREDAAEYCRLHQSQWGTEIVDDLYNCESTFYYPIPVNMDVVADEEILPYDDYEKIIDRNEIIGVSPCQCRLRRELMEDYTQGVKCEHPLETCLTFGEEAEYYIENGIARQIDGAEAREILQRSIDAGMVIQSAYSKNTEVICQCHGDCCDILSSYVALGAALDNNIGAVFNCFPNLSHYNLVVDQDACIQCGMCAQRCPMFAVTMDEETGYPVVDGKCIRCGQCGTTCPASARKLTVADSVAELPRDMLGDYNLKAAYRLANGQVHPIIDPAKA